VRLSDSPSFREALSGGLDVGILRRFVLEEAPKTEYWLLLGIISVEPQR
jgi:hypothetical protein